MKDYAKITRTARDDKSATPPPKGEKQPNLIRTAKDRQLKEGKSKSLIAKLIILFIFIGVGFGVVRQYLSSHHIHFSNEKVGKAPKSVHGSDADSQNAAPQFDFYTVLPKGSVPPGAKVQEEQAASSTNTNDDNTPSAAPANPPPQNTAPVETINTEASNGKFYLNVGDYTSSDSAQQTLSQLLLMGVQASVMTKDDGGNTLYEVLVGPFPDQATMNVVRSQLSAHDINTTVIQSN